MLAARAAVRRAPLRSATAFSRSPRYTRRFDSSYADSRHSSSGSGALAGAIAGGLTALIVGYGFYRYSGTQNAVTGFQAVKDNYESALKRATASAPKPNEAIQWLRQSANSYLGVVPGAKSYIDSTFDGLEQIQKQHGPEVDKIVKRAYTDLKQVNDKEGVNGVTKAWEVIQRAAKQIGELASGAGGDWWHKNPEFQAKFSGKLNDMKRLADQYGPEAQKKVDETWKQVQDILKGGLNAGSMEKVRKLIESKLEDVKKMSEQALNKGLEESKSYLDKTSQARDFVDRGRKDFVDQSKDKLKNANLDDVWRNSRNTASSGRTAHWDKNLAKDGTVQLKETTAGHTLDYFLNLTPGGADLSERIRQMKLGESRGGRFENFIKETVNEVHNVLDRKVDQGKKLVNDIQQDRKYALK